MDVKYEISQDGKTIFLIWNPPTPKPAGYEFFKDNVRVSNTWNPDRYLQADGTCKASLGIIDDGKAHTYGVAEVTTPDQGYVVYPAPLPPPTPTPTPSPQRFWPDSAWPNAKAQDHWNPLPNSASLISLFAGDCAKTGGVYVNGLANQNGAWGWTAYFEKDATTTRVVQQKIFGGSVTIPWNPAWKPSPDSDGHFVVIKNDGSYVEFEGLDQSWVGGYGWCAGAAFGNINDADAMPDPKTRHIAGAPGLAGLVMASEVAAGLIPHATKGATISTAASSVYPSWGSDGKHSPGIPMGTWFALPQNFDTSKYSGMVKMIAEAWKTYGHYVTDTGGSCAMQVQSTAQGVSYPVTALVIPTEIVKNLVALVPLKSAY